MAKTEVINNDALTVRVNNAPAKVAKQAASKTVDVIEDVVEETLDILEDGVSVTERTFRNNPAVVIGVAVVAAGVAGFVAWKISEKRTSAKYEDILAQEIEQAKEFYMRLGKGGEFSTPESAVEALVPSEVVSAVSNYQGREGGIRYDKPSDVPLPEPLEESVQVVATEKTLNIFVESATDPSVWDYNHEVAHRDPEKPYVISLAEFQENEEGNEQQTLQYYQGDDVLCDSRDEPIDAVDYTVGDDNLVRFGHGSEDANVVYIRNERLDTDFEVLRSPGHYQKEVLGIEPSEELRHSQGRRPRRMRERDE